MNKTDDGKSLGHLVGSTEEHRFLRTFYLQSTDVNEVYDFLKNNGTTAGFSIQYGVSKGGIKAYEFFRKGKMGKRDIKRMIEEFGIVEWHFSWAWASDRFNLNGTIINVTKVDLSPVQTTLTAIQYKGLLY